MSSVGIKGVCELLAASCLLLMFASSHTLGIFSGCYHFMKHDVLCRGLHYIPWMLTLRMLQALMEGGVLGVEGVLGTREKGIMANFPPSPN